MIDIHTHVLPGVDDGARDLDTALAMLEQAVADATTHLICTPHVLSRVSPEWEQRCLANFERLQEAAGRRGWPLELLLGGEIYLQADLLEYRRHRFFTLDRGGKYVLLELPAIEIPQFTETVLFNLRLQGYYVVLAHPERNSSLLGRLDRIRTLVERGAWVQVNAGSLLGRFGSEVERFSRKLIRDRLVHFVASDAHDPASRKPVLSPAATWVTEHAGPDVAYRLFTGNPRQLLTGEPLEVPDLPEPEEQPGRFRRLLNKIFK